MYETLGSFNFATAVISEVKGQRERPHLPPRTFQNNQISMRVATPTDCMISSPYDCRLKS